MRVARTVFVLLAVCMVFVSCYYQNTGTPDAWNLTDRQLDSISFYTTHHYTRNFNFLVKADSLELIVQHPTEYVNGLPVDTLAVHGGDRLVVADIVTMPADTLDSIWVKVARDQQSMGWIHEQTMLADVAPDAPISQFIDFFSDTHLLIVMGILVLAFAVFLCRRLLPLGAKMVHFNDIDSVYPMLLCLLVAASAVFYSTIQIFAPDSWRHYYYHPTLNPFSVPLHLGLFLLSVWAIVVAAIAAVDDIRHKLTTGDAFFYYLGLMGVCAVDYVVFSVSTLYYIGYPLLVAYVVVAMRHHISYHRAKLLCGRCGGVIPNKGVCPHCGAMNE